MVKASKFCHVTHILKFLHWLKINERIEYTVNVFLLPTKLLPLLNYLSTAWSLISRSCSCYSLCCHPLSTTYTFFSKNHQSLISLCITSSLESTSYLIPPASYKTPSWWCHIYKFTSHLLTTLILHHTFTVSFIPIQAQNSPFPQIVSTAYSLLAPTSAFSDYTGPDLLGSTVFFHFCLLFIFLFWSCGRLSWLNCQLSSAR